MLSLEEALERVLAAVAPLDTELVDLRSSAGRICSEDIRAAINLPTFDNSAMDGFAVRAADVSAATADRPVRLSLVGVLAAGEGKRFEIVAGKAARVFTGSPLPDGADAVVMQEDTKSDEGSVDVLDPVKPWENVRFRGEDVKAGDRLVARGDAVTVGKTAVLSATGVQQLKVFRRPAVALLSTGDELCEAGTTLNPGKIYESNRVVLGQLVKEAGGNPIEMPIVRDNLDTTRAALVEAFERADVVITSGGVSVGERDFVKAAFEAIGGTQDFWRVAIRPGKPLLFGRLGSKLLFGLPGNPVSAFVTFLLLVRPALLRLQGATCIGLPRRPAVIGPAPIINSGDRRHFIRVCVEPDGAVHSAGVQASHTLASLARANALLDVPPNASLTPGTRVEVLQW